MIWNEQPILNVCFYIRLWVLYISRLFLNGYSQNYCQKHSFFWFLNSFINPLEIPPHLSTLAALCLLLPKCWTELINYELKYLLLSTFILVSVSYETLPRLHHANYDKKYLIHNLMEFSFNKNISLECTHHNVIIKKEKFKTNHFIVHDVLENVW